MFCLALNAALFGRGHVCVCVCVVQYSLRGYEPRYTCVPKYRSTRETQSIVSRHIVGELLRAVVQRDNDTIMQRRITAC